MDKLDDLLESLCQPKEGLIKDSVELALYTIKAKRFIYCYSFMAFLGIPYYLLVYPSHSDMAIFLLAHFFIVILTLATCRSWPYFYRAAYYVFLLAVGPVNRLISNDGLFLNYTVMHMLPMLSFYLDERRIFFVFVSIVQILYQTLLYRGDMEALIKMMDPQQFSNIFSLYQMVAQVFIMVARVGMRSNFELSHSEMTKREKEKGFADKQRLFILGFSHELRNKLNNVLGSINLALMENVEAKVGVQLKNARVHGEMLLQLINNILDRGNLEIGDVEINIAPVQISETMRNVWGFFNEVISSKGLKGRLYVSSKLPQFIKADSYRLTQILFNLISNSIKFTEKGSIDVYVDWISDVPVVRDESFCPYPFDDEGVYEKELSILRYGDTYTSYDLNNNEKRSNSRFNSSSIAVSELAGILKVTVNDTGCGMTPFVLGNLFTKNMQPSHFQLGTSLGLFITKQLCKKMGGDIKAFSKPNKGSSFIMCIPSMPIQILKRNSTENELSQANLSEPTNSNVLIVDDEELSRLVLSNYFAKLGIGIADKASDGLDAFEKYKRLHEQNSRPRLVSMDLTMPVWDGKTAAKRIREYEREHGLSECILLIASGNSSESEVRECMDEAGHIRAHEFLKKPVRIDDIKQIIQRYA